MRDEDHRGVERLQLALEPLEARDVEVVRRLVEQQQVGVAAERARERRARQLAARERAQRPVEVLVGEAEAAQHRGRVVAPAVAARVLEPRLRLRVAVQRRLVVRAAAPSPARATRAPARARRGRRAPESTYSRSVTSRSSGGRWSCSATRVPFCERELAAVLLGLAGEHAEQRRLAGAVRAGERDAVAPLDAERDAVEEDGCRRAPCGGWRRSTTAIALQGRFAAWRPCSRSTSARPRCARSASTSARSRSTSCGRRATTAATRTRSSRSSAQVIDGRDEDADAVGTSCFGHSLLALDADGQAADAGPRLARHAQRRRGRVAAPPARPATAVHARTGALPPPELLAGEARLARRDRAGGLPRARPASSPSATTSTRSCSASSRPRASRSPPAPACSTSTTGGWDAELLDVLGVDERAAAAHLGRAARRLVPGRDRRRLLEPRRRLHRHERARR